MGWRIFTVWVGLAVCTGAGAQYPGHVAKKSDTAPVLRAVSVLEWVGEPGRPSSSRLVPVAVYDGEQLNDGTIYMTRPEPLAVSGGVEYELQTAGRATGIYDVFGSAQVGGFWRGFGIWKPLSTSAKAEQAGVNTSSLYAPVDLNDEDTPTLKRKHPKGTDLDEDDPAKPKVTSESGKDAEAQKPEAANVDPDRPTLKRKASDDATGAKSDQAKPAPVADTDPERPTIRRSRKAVDAGMLETSAAAPDPDRPRLKRGKPAELEVTETPRLFGMPPSMQQAVAVSDTRNRPEHPWKYSWADPVDEEKMKSLLEAIARTELGLNGSVAPVAPAKPVRRTAGKRAARPAPDQSEEPVALAEEKFRVFELAYGSTATLVLTAATPKPDPVASAATMPDETPTIKRGKPTARAAKAEAQTELPPKPVAQKFVTLIAQPDLYGGILVLFKSTTDAAHLDETPRMRLVDAVDVMGDNRGELLFELRADQQRQFALYRVLRGSAEPIFTTVAVP